MSCRSRETIGPNVVIPTMTESNPSSAVERIAAFAAAARPEHLTNETLRLFKRNILDSIGCAIAALPGRPFQALREQFEEYRAPGRCTLIGGGKTSADQAALFNSGLVRYVDILDSYMAGGGASRGAGRGIHGRARRGARNPMPILGRGSSDDQGFQPRHSACDLCRRGGEFFGLSTAE